MDSLDGVYAVTEMETAFGFDIGEKEAMSITSTDKAI